MPDCFIKRKKNRYEVMHSVGEGVCRESLDTFCKCEDFVVLRFHPNPVVFHKNLDKLSNRRLNFVGRSVISSGIDQIKVTDNTTEDVSAFVENVRTFIHDEKITRLFKRYKINVPKFSNKQKMLARDEGVLYDDLVKQKLSPEDLVPQRLIPLVIKQATLKEGAAYDYNFNFVDFTKLSCVEFVWYCYKSIAPLHQIKRELYTYFGCIKAFVIIPDKFLENDFFTIEYSSIKMEREELINYAKSNHFNFWRFFLTVLFWELALYVAVSLLWYLKTRLSS